MTRRPETDVRLDVEPGAARPAPRPIDRKTFHVALLGDFSGRAARSVPARGRLEPVVVDRDEVDAVLGRFGPVVRAGLGDGENGDAGLEVAFRGLEDFHPDRLVERVPLFRSIREVAAAGGSGSRSRAEPGGGSRPAPVEEMLSGSVLDRIVDADEEPDDGAGTGEGGRPQDPLRAWVDDIVEPHLEESPDPDDARVAARVEELVAEGMRELLRSPGLRRLEALWRGVDWLVRRVDTGPRLTIHLVDATKGGLTGDGDAFGELLRRGAGHQGEPWSVVAAAWEFGPEPDDLVLLRELARRAAGAGAVLLAGGRPALAGLPSLSDAGDRSAWGEPDRLWAAFRREPEARSVGLLLPRFLLRLPYGAETDPCERLELEEIPGAPTTDDFVWGPAVLPLVAMLARAFVLGEKDLVGAFDPEVHGLPLHVYRAGGEPRATPCTEVALTRDDADRLVDAGLMPYAWSRGSDGLRLVRLHSVADPPAGLAGWWRR